MNQPTFFGEGYSPRMKDTRLRVWKKVLGVLQSAGGADPANDPKPNDTLYQTKTKVLKARQ